MIYKFYRGAFLIGVLLFSVTAFGQTKYTFSGYVREKGSGELLIGVNIYVPKFKTGATTNNYGFYSITLPVDSFQVSFSYVGYQPSVRQIRLDRNIELNIDLQPDNTLQEVEIVADQQQNVSQTPQMSVVEVPVRQIKEIPALLGEKDVLKVLQLMPGVQKGSEGNSGLYVRGGGPDQNLLILDDAVVYNAYHVFGFFSLFNGDALKSVELTKGGFPARYGGRLSSVVEMNMKEGNKEGVHGEAGIGLISSRLMLEGPLKKGKSSFLVSGRRTYFDILTRPLLPEDTKGGFYFYDLNAKVNYDFGGKNKLYLSGYFGRDRFNFTDNAGANKSSGGFQWGNATGTLRWNHLFSNKLFANASLIFSQYRFNIVAKEESYSTTYRLNYYSGIRDFAIKYDLDYLPNPKHAVKFGLLSTYHRFTPSALVTKDNILGDTTIKNHVDVIESGLYVEDYYRPSERLRINAGLRLSSLTHKQKTYLNLEPRFSAAYMLGSDFSVKASYATMNQYIHLLSNTGIGLPTDLWVSSTERIGPQRSQQVALGIARDFREKNLSLTIEGYYKKSNNILGYKEGASFLMLDDLAQAEEVPWEDNVTTGQGWSYGVEFLLQRKAGKFMGWIGYTLSWTQLQFDSLNFGKKYYAKYDRRHDISLVGTYHMNESITLSFTWVYGTGSALTMAGSQFTAPRHDPAPGRKDIPVLGQMVNDYGAKNNFRMAPYHRLDLGIQYHKKNRIGERTWEFSIYNAYNRHNPFFYFADSDYDTSKGTETRKLFQITLFPMIPSISYSLKF